MGKTKLAEVAGPVRLLDLPEYAGEVTKLERLRSELADNTDRLKNLSSIRLSEDCSRYLGRNVNPFTADASEVLNRLVLEIAGDGEITERTARKIRLCARQVPLADEFDRDAVEKIHDADRRVQLLGRAIVLQERKVRDQKNLALVRVGNSARGDREKTARKIASCALDLINAVKEENSFFERLRLQDEALPATQNPGRFPVALGPESEVCRWLATVLQVGESEARSLMAEDPARRESEASSSSAASGV